MGFVLPVLVPETPGVDAGDEEGGDGDVEGHFAPEVCASERALVSEHGDVGAIEGWIWGRGGGKDGPDVPAA